MNILRKSILIGFTVLGMAAAQAQDTTPPAGRHDAGARSEHMQARMADMFAKRQAKLHDLLKLTAQQESAWATYQAAIKPAPMSGARPERATFRQLPAPERMAKMIDFSKQRQARMEAHLSALTAFYAQLTPEQKAVFDKRGMGGKRGGHRDHRGGWGHQS